MTKRRKRTFRGSHYRALAEGYKILNPTVAESFQLAAEHYDHYDPALDVPPDDNKASEGERPQAIKLTD